MTWSALAPWGVVVLLCLGFIETYRLAALWDEEDFEKRAYPGGWVRVLVCGDGGWENSLHSMVWHNTAQHDMGHFRCKLLA